MRAAAGATVLAIAFWSVSPALALDEGATEKQAIDACEKKLCTMLLKKEPTGDDLKCQLTKTWTQSTIKEADNQSIQWGHGDARCSVDLNVTRAAVVSAMTSGSFTYEVPMHTANCVVEQNGELEKVTARLAPKIVFKDGRAEKIWINLKSVEGPLAIKSTIWTAAKLEDGIGLFHHQMIKATNKFIQKGCAKKYPQLLASAAGTAPNAAPKDKPKKDKPAQTTPTK
jgi:hypothetical protein